MAKSYQGSSLGKQAGNEGNCRLSGTRSGLAERGNHLVDRLLGRVSRTAPDWSRIGRETALLEVLSPNKHSGLGAPDTMHAMPCHAMPNRMQIFLPLVFSP